jgi:citrate lyase subunit beta/citryl-CoA lyase
MLAGRAHVEGADEEMIRSFLFVPGDSERKQAKALGSAADAVIIDLEDSVAEAKLPEARQMAAAALRGASHSPSLWIRVNALSSGKLVEDLVAVMGAAPHGIVLPKVVTPFDVTEISHYLSALEQREGLPVGSTKLLVIATETPAALLSLNKYVDVFNRSQRVGQTPKAFVGGAQNASSTLIAYRRLTGLTWGMEDLGAALGTSAKVDDAGNLTFTFQMARSTCLLTAAALNVQAIDGVHADFRDSEGLKREAAAARRDGFTGKLAIHPDQVEIINAAFSPSAAEVEHARKIVAAFEAAPDAGVLSLDGAMIDRPHLVQAQRLLAAASRTR